MNYPDGLEIQPGDLVRIDTRHRGLVLSCIDTDQHLPGADGWGYLGEGVMVDTDFDGLVHYTDRNRDELELLQRDAPPNWRTSDTPPSKNWKLELRYGRLDTPFHHYTIVADGIVGELADGFECPPGPAIMTMKVWATDHDEAFAMLGSIGGQIGFTAGGRIELYETDPEQPPGEHPAGYAIAFTPYDADG